MISLNATQAKCLHANCEVTHGSTLSSCMEIQKRCAPELSESAIAQHFRRHVNIYADICRVQIDNTTDMQD